MAPTASEVVGKLNLKPHPEGGFFSETFRDTSITLSTSQLPPECKYLFTFHTNPSLYVICSLIE